MSRSLAFCHLLRGAGFDFFTGMAKARIALELKIGEATVYRILARDRERDREQAHPASSA
ncbi:MAG TPA: hypothetical protein VE844_20955 [Gammaproteobacteria bacterium]|nr:hypothetical protein [Gammaproteobacteria bacterium]